MYTSDRFSGVVAAGAICLAVFGCSSSGSTAGTAGTADDVAALDAAVPGDDGPTAQADATTDLGEAEAGAADAQEPIPEGPTTHVYQSTASVGDFLVVTVDKAAQTVSYENRTNGWKASDVPYVQDAAGIYTFPGDPNGHLRQAIELEDVALVLDVDHAGPNRDTRALAIGAIAQPATVSDLSGGSGSATRYVNFQFRTSNGGMEIGDVLLSSAGTQVTVDHEGYWPLGATQPADTAFKIDHDPFVFDVPGGDQLSDYLSFTQGGGGQVATMTIFKTASGFAFDMDNGNMIMLQQPASAAFDPASAGTYQALSYEKQNASGTSDGVVEPGDASVHPVTVTISAEGHLSTASEEGLPLEGDLVPASDSSWLAGAGKLDAAHLSGLFAFRVTTEGAAREVFVAFVPSGLIFASFRPDAGGAYSYSYGAAVKQAP